MSFIQFESGREKDKARQELREARSEMLAQAQKRAEQRNRQEREKELRGDANWMLPAVAKKLDSGAGTSSKKDKKTKSKKNLKKTAKEKAKSKKSAKKKSKKHHRQRSSSSDSDSDSSSTSSDSTSSTSSGKDEKRRRRSKKKSHKSQKSEDEWVEKIPVEMIPGETPVALQRDSWMTSENLRLKTFMRERKEPTKPNEKLQQIDAYDPAKSRHELNPYWKSNGTGLPGFQRPKDDADEVTTEERSKPSSSSGGRGWKKHGAVSQKQKTPPGGSSDSSEYQEDEEMASSPVCLTDEQINELASKAIKAELKGKTELASDLNHQLEAARKARAEFLASGKQIKGPNKRSKSSASSSEHVLLTRTDQTGQVRPLIQSRSRLESSTAEAESKKKKMDTHVDGQRVRYFADDDRYDIKQMFEREKHSTAAESNLEYANILSKHRNPNDDLEDIFSDRIRRNAPTQAEEEKRELQAAIREHERLSSTLENCERCLDSGKLDKQLLVSLGQRIYLSLPWHIGLQSGHCILSPMQHVACCTQLDEDAWQELNEFRKSLTRMFASQGKDCIFYEIANKLHRRPHLSVHCIPIPSDQGEAAPFYFKKAIEESEQEWCINKQLVTLKPQKSLRSAIPKGLPYVWIHFGMESGFAHVIEDQERFPPNFALEIIGGMLELNPNTWRKPRKEQNIIAKVKTLADKWQKYDCTET